MFDLILVTLDGSKYGERALESARGLATLTDAQVVLLSVLQATDSERAVNTTREYLRTHCDGLLEAGISEVSTAVRYGEPARQIVEAARELDADLIVMSTHGAGAGDRYDLGSVAQQVLSSSPCPIFAVRINRPAPPRSREEERWQGEGGGNVA